MPHYINAIVDKSALQSLSAREAEWLFHHFSINLPPVLFAEVLADLAKSKGLTTGTADGDVRMLSKKITSYSVYLNEAHHSLIAGELMGHPVDLSHRPVVGNAKSARMPDGSVGLYLDQTPFQGVMERWVAGDFDGMEREFAKEWREDQKTIDLEQLIRETKHLRTEDMKSLDAVVERAHALIFADRRDYAHLDNLLQLAGAEPSHRAAAIRRWNRSDRPHPPRFLPYTTFVARLEAIFMFGLHAGVITTRPTNRIDVEYFKYLPFTEVFSSGDQLHATLFPAFAHSRQSFVPAAELKAALREMADHYDAMAEDERKLGTMAYADYPPVKMDNAITKLFDQRFPNWREGANLARPPRDTSGDAELLADLNAKLDWLKRHGR